MENGKRNMGKWKMEVYENGKWEMEKGRLVIASKSLPKKKGD